MNRKRPLLIYDGTCGFCKRWVRRFLARTGNAFDYKPYQDVKDEFPDIPETDFERGAQLIELDNTRHSGARAMLGALALGSGPKWPLKIYQLHPIAKKVIDLVYQFIASNRSTFSLLDRWIYGTRIAPPSFAISSDLLIRTTAACFFIAFASLWVQLDGLYGPEGIAPISNLVEIVWERLGKSAIVQAPSIFWLQSSQPFLHAVCALGVFASLATLVGYIRAPGLLLLWFLYLSFLSVGSPFLNFQWDSLLLETAFLAAFLLPWSLKRVPFASRLPNRWIRWLLIYLLFRLMFASGVVKLTSNDSTWSSLTALEYHFFTQPLPTPLAWWAHQSPEFLLTVATALMFLIELILPFLFFAPHRLRLLATGATLSLQLGIMATGNYGFFNLLSIGLCLLLIDDETWQKILSRCRIQLKEIDPKCSSKSSRISRVGKIGGLTLISACILFMTGVQWFGTFRTPIELPKFLSAPYQALSSLRTVNSYGLFAVMTTERRELEIQGSQDGIEWKTYDFNWKPSETQNSLPWVAPHMPRLDWQMWFAALSAPQSPRNQWLIRTCQQLLTDSLPVGKLLARNPFPDNPPKYIRIIAYQYDFTSLKERHSSGSIWKRSYDGIYIPPITKEMFSR
ncbi:MAG: lipase maturation factor family protein [Verrucomicrobiota bacterium]